jgi:predicted dehydrogenase
MTERREFIKKSVAGTAGIALGATGFSAKSYGNIVGANDRIVMATIGVRGQGHGHLKKWASLKESRNTIVKTICDVDESLYAERQKTVEDIQGSKPGTEWDMHKVFEDKDIDAVSVAAPNHWHALATIWAAQAGKHVYVEKPSSHNVWEGRKMIEAARKYNVMVQVGFQNRSIANVMDAMNKLHNGIIGDVYMARGTCFKPRDSFGIAKDSTPPASLHYDRWLGPAQWRPYNEKRGHYNWHWHWNTGNGDTGNQGPHQFDVARWGLNKNEHPVSVYSVGGIFKVTPQECSQETPNTQTSVFNYEDGKILEFETRGVYTGGEANMRIKIGNTFYGTDGWMEVNGSRWKAYKGRETSPFAESSSSKTEKSSIDPTFLTAPGGSEHYANFIDAIRSGSRFDLHCDILEGHLSSCLPHLGNIAYRLDRKLDFNGQYEKFVNDSEADSYLTRNYRAPYIVPENV